MSKRKKRLERIRQNPKNVTLEDLRKLLEDYNFRLDRVVGSHHIFLFQETSLTVRLVIPYHRPLKINYVLEALKIIDKITELQGDEDDE